MYSTTRIAINERHEFEQRIIDGKEGFSDSGFPIQVIRALKRQLPVPICIKSTTSLDSAMYEPIGERDTELLIPNGQGDYSKLHSLFVYLLYKINIVSFQLPLAKKTCLQNLRKRSIQFPRH